MAERAPMSMEEQIEMMRGMDPKNVAEFTKRMFGTGGMEYLDNIGGMEEVVEDISDPDPEELVDLEELALKNQAQEAVVEQEPSGAIKDFIDAKEANAPVTQMTPEQEIIEVARRMKYKDVIDTPQPSAAELYSAAKAAHEGGTPSFRNVASDYAEPKVPAKGTPLTPAEYMASLKLDKDKYRAMQGKAFSTDNVEAMKIAKSLGLNPDGTDIVSPQGVSTQQLHNARAEKNIPQFAEPSTADLFASMGYTAKDTNPALQAEANKQALADGMYDPEDKMGVQEFNPAFGGGLIETGAGGMRVMQGDEAQRFNMFGGV